MAQALTLTAQSLAELEAQMRALSADAALEALGVDAPLVPMDDAAFMLAAEQSAARYQHLAALQRDFDELAALTANDAIGWVDRREHRAACTLQSAWRRRVARNSFIYLAQLSREQRRNDAAAVIQRAQRARQRIAHEASAPIAQETVQSLVKQIASRTLQMAEELGNALQKRDAWKKAVEASAASGVSLDGDEPKLPGWYETPFRLQVIDSCNH